MTIMSSSAINGLKMANTDHILFTILIRISVSMHGLVLVIILSNYGGFSIVLCEVTVLLEYLTDKYLDLVHFCFFLGGGGGGGGDPFGSKQMVHTASSQGNAGPFQFPWDVIHDNTLVVANTYGHCIRSFQPDFIHKSGIEVNG